MATKINTGNRNEIKQENSKERIKQVNSKEKIKQENNNETKQVNNNETKQEIEIDGQSLTIEDIINVSRNGYKVYISKSIHDSLTGFNNSACLKDDDYARFKDDDYTPFKDDDYARFKDKDIKEYDKDLYDIINMDIETSALAINDPLPYDICRAVLLLRINTLLSLEQFGNVRPVVINIMVQMLNSGVIPCLPYRISLYLLSSLVLLLSYDSDSIGDVGIKAYYKSNIIILTDGSIRNITGDGSIRDKIAKVEEDVSNKNIKNLKSIPSTSLRSIPDKSVRNIPDKSVRTTTSNENVVIMSGIDAMRMANISSIKLTRQECLSIISGSIVATAIACINLFDAEKLLQTSTAAASLTMEALMSTPISEGIANITGSAKPLEKSSGSINNAIAIPLVTSGSELCSNTSSEPGLCSNISPELGLCSTTLDPESSNGVVQGQVQIARQVKKLTKNSLLISSNNKTQDIQSIRCVPQVYGAIWLKLKQVRSIIQDTINSVDVEEIITFEMDTLKSMIFEIGKISERRIIRLSDEKFNNGLSCLSRSLRCIGPNYVPRHIASSLSCENYSLSLPSGLRSGLSPSDLRSGSGIVIGELTSLDPSLSSAVISGMNAHKILRNTEKILAIELFGGSIGVYIRLKKLAEIAIIPFLGNSIVTDKDLTSRVTDECLANKVTDECLTSKVISDDIDSKGKDKDEEDKKVTSKSALKKAARKEAKAKAKENRLNARMNISYSESTTLSGTQTSSSSNKSLPMIQPLLNESKSLLATESTSLLPTETKSLTTEAKPITLGQGTNCIYKLINDCTYNGSNNALISARSINKIIKLITSNYWFSELDTLLSLIRKDKDASTTASIALSIPPGTRDFSPAQMKIRHECINIIKSVFELHGGQELDTPAFEKREILLGKYGNETNKLVFDLVDQGGQMLTLRYDLTVPFARYMAMNNLMRMKRYQIAKVWRRDNPSMAQGRYREFYQCDLDFAGNGKLMLYDAEILSTLCDVLKRLFVYVDLRSINGITATADKPDNGVIARPNNGVIATPNKSANMLGALKGCESESATPLEHSSGSATPLEHSSGSATPFFKIKISHRQLLTGLLEFCGVGVTEFSGVDYSRNKEKLMNQVCSSIDKLDKHPWYEIKKELFDRGLKSDVISRIGELMTISGPCEDVLNNLNKIFAYDENDENKPYISKIKNSLYEMKVLFGYLKIFGCLDYMEFNLSLARGLDYYTGVIFEAVCNFADSDSEGVESVKDINTNSSEIGDVKNKKNVDGKKKFINGKDDKDSKCGKNVNDCNRDVRGDKGNINGNKDNKCIKDVSDCNRNIKCDRDINDGKCDRDIKDNDKDTKVNKSKNTNTKSTMGSIAAGGRYDGLIGMFREDKHKIPSVGCSIGIERIFAIMEQKLLRNIKGDNRKKNRESFAQVLIHYLEDKSNATLESAMKLCSELWNAQITAEIRNDTHKLDLKSQIEYCLNNEIPCMVVIGQVELKRGTINIRTMKFDNTVGDIIEQPRADAIIYLKSYLAR